MGKVLFVKYLVLLTFLTGSVNFAFCQESFSLRGQFLLDKKPVIGAVVTVYDGNKTVAQAATNKIGKFTADLQFQKNYVLQFKKRGMPTQKVVITTRMAETKGTSRSKVVVFALSSSKQSKEGPDASDAVTSFHLNDNGMLEQKKEIVAITPIRVKDEGEVEVEEIIDELENETELVIAEIPETERAAEWGGYDVLRNKKDSIILMAEKKAEMILASAQKQANNIIKSAKRIKSASKRSVRKSENEIKRRLEKLALDEKKFLEREDVKKYQRTIDVYSKKARLSKKDSLEYYKTVVLFNEEMIKSARLQLEVDKLNAKTKEDSLIIQAREDEINKAEQEILDAKMQIEVQRLEIKQKNTMLIFSIVALAFLVVLFLMAYKSYRDKKRNNAKLEKQNNEIANKNKKIIDSIRYAQTIQQAILPVKSIIDKHFDWFVVFQPKDIVSGDFYWFHHFEDRKMSVFAVVDCTGHGVPGAFMSLIGNRLLMEAVKEKKMTNPVQILEEVDESIRVALMQDETSNNDGMDICICTVEYLEGDKCKVDFAGAKRPLFFSDLKEKKMKYLKGTVRGIGGKKRIREKPKKQFVKHEMIMDKGEILYLTTDGFFDLQSPNRKKFGRVNFMDLLEKNLEKPLPEQKEAIMDALHLHKGSEFQIDDITILGLKL